MDAKITPQGLVQMVRNCTYPVNVLTKETIEKFDAPSSQTGASEASRNRISAAVAASEDQHALDQTMLPNNNCSSVKLKS